ncbi:MAG: SDR family NAD(P)-dependent oxidoreductase [Actinomycetota bacterium]|nr:MAG: SDR family NAD(P)-dependent oxidoreductase [Actinomycetota bacterium]
MTTTNSDPAVSETTPDTGSSGAADTSATDPGPTAAEVAAGSDLSGKRILVTGGGAGIGLETVRALAQVGGEVTIAVRNVAAGEAAAADVAATVDGPPVSVRHLDLADQKSVAAFVAGWDGPLDILIANAGIMAGPLQRTAEGWELQFATNHLGHFALAVGLRPALAAAGHARVVVLSSAGHLNSPVDFDDIHFQVRPYDPWIAYAQSKTANVLFAVGAAPRWADDGIDVNAVMPGRIRTNLLKHVTDEEVGRIRQLPAGAAVTWSTPDFGAATSVYVAVAPELAGVSGKYFERCALAKPNVPGTREGFAPYAVDPDGAQRLWQLSSDWTGLG